MEDFNKLASYLANLNYSSVRYIELVCSLPDFGKEVSYLPNTPQGEKVELDLVEVKDLLKSLTNSAAKYDVDFAFDQWKQKPNCLRMMVDVRGPNDHPSPYAHIQLNFVRGDYNVEMTKIEYEDYSTCGTLWEFAKPEMVGECIKVISLASLGKEIEWHINMPEMDFTFMEELASIFEGFGFVTGEEHLQTKDYPGLDTEESFVAKRKDVTVKAIIDRRVNFMRGNTYVFNVK